MCVYISLYICIYVTYLVNLLAEYYLFNFMHALYFKKCEALLAVHAHSDTKGICLHFLVFATVKTPQKTNF